MVTGDLSNEIGASIVVPPLSPTRAMVKGVFDALSGGRKVGMMWLAHPTYGGTFRIRAWKVPDLGDLPARVEFSVWADRTTKIDTFVASEDDIDAAVQVLDEMFHVWGR